MRTVVDVQNAEGRLANCERAFLVVNLFRHSDHNAKLRGKRQTGLWTLREDRIPLGSAIFIAAQTTAKKYPYQIYFGILKRILNCDDGRVVFNLDKITLSERVEASIQRFFLNTALPAGNRVNEIKMWRSGDLIDDIEELIGDDGDRKSTRRQEIEARLGQGEFRRKVLGRWGGECAVTGAGRLEVIRASHILPWKTHKPLRLDPENGLPLVATLDALFDKHLIAFDKSGRLKISKQLGNRERVTLGLTGDLRLRRPPSKRQMHYLAEHMSQLV